MSKFYSIYISFDEFYKTFLRGNEIEFSYQNKNYNILPIFDFSKKVSGVMIGEAYSDTELICHSSDELFRAEIADTYLGNILDQIEITWYNF